MAILTAVTPTVQRALTRALDAIPACIPPAPDPGLAVSPAAWLDAQAAYHDCQHELGEGDVHEYLADEIRAIAAQFRSSRYHLGREILTVGQYLDAQGPYCGADIRRGLAVLAIPAQRHHSELAEVLDDIAASYLAMGSELARLVAYTIEAMAEECEHFGARRLDQYLDAMVADREARALDL